MKSLGHKKPKRVLTDKLVKKDLGNFSSQEDIIINQARQETASFFSMSGNPVKKVNVEPYRTVPGEYFEPNQEVVEAAFQHQGVLTDKDMSDSGIHTSLDEMYENQEWDEWRENWDYIDLVKGQKVNLR